MSNASELQSELQVLKSAAAGAARITMTYFRNEPKVTWKEGNSPVTEADYAADTYLKETLLAARPDYGWLSEETADSPERFSRRRTFIVDPIDGTRAFIAGRDLWCVSVALVENGVSIAGVLDCPARDEIFEATCGGGSRLNGRPLAGSVMNERAPRFAGAKSWLSAYAQHTDLEPEAIGHIPSLAYRIAAIADGRFDGSFIKPDCHDWDIAAAGLILTEAGGALVEQDGTPARYGLENVRHGLMIAAMLPVIPTMLAVVANPVVG